MDTRAGTVPAPRSLRAWWLAIRPATLTAAAAPVLVGTAVAHVEGRASARVAVAAVLGAAMIQIGTNLANDVFDFEKGADSADRIGPIRVTQAGLLAPSSVRRAMWLAMSAAVAVGVYLTSIAGWPIVAIGIASVIAGIAYTGGPYPLGYHGLGDVFVFLFFGLVAVVGTAFAHVGRAPLGAWLGAVPIGALSTAVLVVNNVRDRHTDARAGKRTLVVRLGRRGGVAEYAVLLAIAYLVPFALALRAASLWPLLPLLTAPVAVVLARAVGSEDGARLDPYLGRTARLLLAYAALLALGLVCGGRASLP